jgi:Bacterial pre-peptidase C-terminal domain
VRFARGWKRSLVRGAAALGLVATFSTALGVASSSTPALADVSNTCSAVRVTTSVGAWHDSRIDTRTDLDWYGFSVTAPRHVMVTLGALSSDLSLAIYDSSCHLITTSTRSGTAFEQVYRALARGRYYVRISGVSGATGPYALQFRVLANGLDVLSSRGRVQSGHAIVIADLLNNDATSRDFTDVGAIFYDTRGRVVTAATCQIDAVVIAPWHRAPLECGAVVPPSYDHYRLVVNQSAQAGYVMHRLTVRRDASSVLPDGSRLYSGTLTNNNSFRVTEVVLAVTVRDGRGRVLSVDATFLRDIGAHGSVSWRIQTEPVGGARQVSFYADARRPGH